MQLPAKVGAGTAAAGLFGIIFGWGIFPALLKSQIRKEMSLANKTDNRAFWQKLPFAMHFKVYMFNYTNPEEIHNGAIPIVKEIGPYHFDEWKEKVELEDNEEEDTITYKKNDVFHFRPDLSGPGLTGEEVITMPNTIMLAATTVISKEKPKLLKTVGKAFNSVFNDPKNIFMNVKALDILFRGMFIECSKTDFAAKAFCTVLKKEAVDNVIVLPNNDVKFSIFGKRNLTIDQQRVTVKRGIRDVMDVGQVVALDGRPEIGLWRGECDQFQGTDWTVFPPFLTEKDRLGVYFGDLCRNFRPWFTNKTKYGGIKTNRYVVDIGHFADDPELRCMCQTDDTCPPKGLMELQKCTNAPMYASLPHYLDCDPELLTKVKGLNPDPKKHAMEIDFEPLSGTPMAANLRMMFSMVLIKNDEVEIHKNLPDTMAPLFWIDEGLALNKGFVKMLKKQLFYPMRIAGMFKWMLVIVGIIGPIAALIFQYSDQIPGLASTPKKVKVDPAVDQMKSTISVIGDSRRD